MESRHSDRISRHPNSQTECKHPEKKSTYLKQFGECLDMHVDCLDN